MSKLTSLLQICHRIQYASNISMGQNRYLKSLYDCSFHPMGWSKWKLLGIKFDGQREIFPWQNIHTVNCTCRTQGRIKAHERKPCMAPVNCILHEYYGEKWQFPFPDIGWKRDCIDRIFHDSSFLNVSSKGRIWDAINTFSTSLASLQGSKSHRLIPLTMAQWSAPLMFPFLIALLFLQTVERLLIWVTVMVMWRHCYDLANYVQSI